MLSKNFFVFNARGGGNVGGIYRGNTDLTTPPTTLRQRVAENEKKTQPCWLRDRPCRRWFVERAKTGSLMALKWPKINQAKKNEATKVQEDQMTLLDLLVSGY